MGVKVKAVFTNGTVSGFVNWGCFGFAYSEAGTMQALKRPPKKIKEIIFFPERKYNQNKENDKIAEEYLTLVFRLKIVRDRINLVAPDKGVMSVFTDGVKADVTKLSGQEWVGLFELVRNVQSSFEFVTWVVNLYRSGISFASALLACRVFNLKSKTNMYDGRDFVWPPGADTTPNGILSADLGSFIWVRANRRVFKPWNESCDFNGVYYFFGGRVENQNKLILQDTMKGRIPSVVKNIINTVADLNNTSEEDRGWLLKFYDDRIAFTTYKELSDFLKEQYNYRWVLLSDERIMYE